MRLFWKDKNCLLMEEIWYSENWRIICMFSLFAYLSWYWGVDRKKKRILSVIILYHEKSDRLFSLRLTRLTDSFSCRPLYLCLFWHMRSLCLILKAPNAISTWWYHKLFMVFSTLAKSFIALMPSHCKYVTYQMISDMFLFFFVKP